jgi:hypothetical protein
MCLSNVAEVFRRIGRVEKALALAGEAVLIFRQLAKANPVRFEADLAMSLNNLANDLDELGQPQEGCIVVEEAVSLLAPYFKSDQRTFGGRMHLTCENYVRLSRKVARTPSPELQFLIEQILGESSLKRPEGVMRAVDIPQPHQHADPNLAARLNVDYQIRLSQWRRLSWFKRKSTKRPDPPARI